MAIGKISKDFVEQEFNYGSHTIRLHLTSYFTYQISLIKLDSRGRFKDNLGRIEEDTNLSKIEPVFVFLKRHPEIWKSVDLQ